MRLPVIAAVALALGGCVSLFPKGPPSQLYRFGVVDSASNPAPGPPASGPGVVLADVVLPAASTGDAILTVTGDQAAYVEQARWVTPAAQMLREDTERAFTDEARRVHLLRRSEIGAAAAVLRLDVGAFEARYDTPAGAPTVVISLRASLTGTDGAMATQRVFAVRQPASENRVSAIVSAFDTATTTLLGQVVAWTDATAADAAAAQPAVTTRTRSSTTTSSR